MVWSVGVRLVCLSPLDMVCVVYSMLRACCMLCVVCQSTCCVLYVEIPCSATLSARLLSYSCCADLLEPTQPAPISPAPDVQAAADSAASAVQAVLPDAVTVAKDCVRSAVLALMLYDVRDDHRVHTYFDHSMYFGWNKSTWDRSWNPVGNRI